MSPTSAQPSSPPADGGSRSPADQTIELRGVGKTFGAVRALSDIDLTCRAGEVHALVGQNGAGKSTALGVLSGRIAPDGGSIMAFGIELGDGDPRSAIAAGILTIYQELTILPALSAEANVFLGAPPGRAGLLNKREARRRYVELCRDIGVEPLPAGRPAGEASVSSQQMLEIMRALALNARAILFDEPTASLSEAERSVFHDLVRKLRDSGMVVVLVSHNLDEVLQLADHVTVFRDGRRSDSRRTSEWNKHTLIESMVGDQAGETLDLARALEGRAPKPHNYPASSTDDVVPVLRVREVRVPGRLQGIDFQVHAGEIVGIAGLVGSGRSTFLRTLAGAQRPTDGQIFIDGEQHRWPRDVRSSQRLGIALLPEERKTQGLFGAMSSADNVVVSDLGAVSTAGVLSRRRLRRAAQESSQRFGFDPGRLSQPARTLSGGNQQKLMLARWTHRRPRVLLVDEPTRGIDVASKAHTLEMLEELAATGLAIVLVSSEIEEILAVSSRVEVFAHGHHVKSFDSRQAPFDLPMVVHAAFDMKENSMKENAS